MAREYTRHTRAWYYDATRGDWTEEFMLSNGGGQEFAVRWYGNIRGLEMSPNVSVYQDAYKFAFGELAWMFVKIHDREMTPDEFEDMLEAHHFTDVTATVSPYVTR
jgi:hypothetical protein